MVSRSTLLYCSIRIYKNYIYVNTNWYMTLTYVHHWKWRYQIQVVRFYLTLYRRIFGKVPCIYVGSVHKSNEPWCIFTYEIDRFNVSMLMTLEKRKGNCEVSIFFYSRFEVFIPSIYWLCVILIILLKSLLLK